ncbi:CidA/LrgA family protein [Mesobacillus maritimus]|uniref:CidA/LrgA family protein n=1 Tax=Mesobacillus maritimus TaxID=1643336 RepID=UPI00384AB8D6
MKISWFFQLFILIGFLLLGYGIVNVFPIPVPASVLGMILLFLFLLTGMIKLEWIEKVSSFQLKHLPLLFIPPIATLIVSSSFFRVLQWEIMIILMVSSVSCLLGTALTVEWYEKRKRRKTK